MESNNYKRFFTLLEEENKDEAVMFILNLLNTHQSTIEEIYFDYLIPSIQQIFYEESAENLIWHEHTRTAITRTIIEATYPYVIQRRKDALPINKLVMIACPKEEYHEIGALIAMHLFALKGYQVQYLGANTPRKEILSAMAVMNPAIVVLSVTNLFNIVETKELTQLIKSTYPKTILMLGGNAFQDPHTLSQINHDVYLHSLKDILSFEGNES